MVANNRKQAGSLDCYGDEDVVSSLNNNIMWCQEMNGRETGPRHPWGLVFSRSRSPLGLF